MSRLSRLAAALALCAASAGAQSEIDWRAVLQQTGAYVSSDRVTVSGIGGGAGLWTRWSEALFAQGDVALLWGNGNAVLMRGAVGMFRPGLWSPAIGVTATVFVGHRTEMLATDGRRPPAPYWTAGIRCSPLRFAGTDGYASLLEVGYGRGPGRGTALEVTLISVGTSL